MADLAREFIGKTVDEAIDDGLQQLGLRRDQVEIEVVSKGSRGIFGLGSEPARVAIRRKPEPPAPSPAVAEQTPPLRVTDQPHEQSAAVQEEAAETAPADIDKRESAEDAVAEAEIERDVSAETPVREPATAPERAPGEFDYGAETEEEEELAGMASDMLQDVVRLMNFDATVAAIWKPADEHNDRHLLLDIHGADVSPLIGRRGETLASIQYLTRLMVNQQIKEWKNIVVDVDHYKERRISQLTQLANRMADQVVESGRAVSLEPMPANERRIVHLALRDHPDVHTQSSGEGDRRKVHIVANE